MADDKLNRQTYLSKNVGSFPDTASFLGHDYTKVDDLRYGTNPHQTAAFYKPANRNAVIGDMVILKNGKSGLSPRPTSRTSPTPSTSSSSSTAPPAPA